MKLIINILIAIFAFNTQASTVTLSDPVLSVASTCISADSSLAMNAIFFEAKKVLKVNVMDLTNGYIVISNYSGVNFDPQAIIGRVSSIPISGNKLFPGEVQKDSLAIKFDERGLVKITALNTKGLTRELAIFKCQHIESDYLRM